MKYYDQHIHTKYSPDSKQELLPLIDNAYKKGARYFISCNHTDFDMADSHVDWIFDAGGYLQEIDEIKPKYKKMTFLLGIEMGYRKDKLKQINDILSLYDFDLINLSIHDDGIHDYYKKQIFIDETYDVIMNGYLDTIYEAVSNFDSFNVLSHIDYGFKTLKLYDNTVDFFDYKEKIIKILEVLIKKEKALEINSKVQSVINDDNHLINLLTLYKSLGGTKLTLSSDAHDVNNYMLNFDHYMNIIKKCGFNYLSYYINKKEFLWKIN